MDEIWNKIEGYSNNYFVSNLGRVKVVHSKTEHIYNKQIHSHGYEIVFLYDNNKQKNIRVHRLVANSFIPNPQNKCFVNHINGIKTDNRVENLEWVTASENAKHAYKNKLRIPRLKISTADVEIVRQSQEKGYILSEKYGVSQSAISAIRNYKRRISI